ncbi:hypothetical protein N7495_004910 [Penicillium taxi]|uniref:uncharacterized protein n=1 Tax=Penicillium taxi TaxID=168475 RepID=UPI0025458A49|nr:uncharacterized protein N7495_004910 [Penicillium taxi]KAJ5893219.1 hypothetical protein N7495_004910 [Penicillium taxi]
MPSKNSHINGVGTDHQEAHDTSKSHEDVPACQSCRKKKARCSRAQPCSECIRFNTDCVYDERRMKPGLRAGAVDQLYRRIETLENMFLGQEMLWQHIWKTFYPKGSLSESSQERPTDITSLARRRDELQCALIRASSPSSHSNESRVDTNAGVGSRPAKRRRCESANVSAGRMNIDGDFISTEVVTELVDFYFLNIHPWIPMLDEERFRTCVKSLDESRGIHCILHAVIAVCARFSQSESLGDEARKVDIAKKSRQKAILDGMETFSIENLQALVIIAFDTIACGRGPSSWSMVGSMVGTVEQLQLSIEEDELYNTKNSGEILIQRMVFLTPSSSWSEAEERRRVFWTVFLMDRFCSVSTGWKMSLNMTDVKRRLPCEGSIWANQREVQAPFFGISDSKDTESTSSLLSDSRGLINSDAEDSIGGFAYNIEATESLALVTKFFLHHAIKVTDTEKARIWLMKFKELDLRLIQWKLFLPPKWQEASVLNSDGFMDPNLTLAHITHNTAVILLHQGIAYPPSHWQTCSIKLPSTSSAETCLEAASEIATIGQQFLAFSSIFTNPQFSFCLFIAGRVILAHARYYQVIVPSAFNDLISSLLEISRRWTGFKETAISADDNIASIFAKRLIEAHDTSAAAPGPSLDIRQTVYSDQYGEQDTHGLSIGTLPPRNILLQSRTPIAHPRAISKHQLQETYEKDPFSLAFPPLPPAFSLDFPVFSQSDSLSLYTQSGDYQALSPLGIQSYEQQINHCHGHTAPLGDCTTNSHENPSHVFHLTPSPHERISRYGGEHVENRTLNKGPRNISTG